jgi:hypothetical protein
MIAVLDQDELRVGRTDCIEGLAAMLPGHVSVALAMQDAQRTSEIETVRHQEMLASILDELAGDRIGIAKLAWP